MNIRTEEKQFYTLKTENQLHAHTFQKCLFMASAPFSLSLLNLGTIWANTLCLFRVLHFSHISVNFCLEHTEYFKNTFSSESTDEKYLFEFDPKEVFGVKEIFQVYKNDLNSNCTVTSASSHKVFSRSQYIAFCVWSEYHYILALLHCWFSCNELL